MKNKIKQTLTIFFLTALLFAVNPEASYAQDKGDPALRTVAAFTIGGGAGGAVLGAAYWLMDPLNPNADLKETALVGFGIGAIAGFIFGINQLYKQAVIPGYQTQPPDEIIQGMRDRQNDPTMFGYEKSFQPKIKTPIIAFSF